MNRFSYSRAGNVSGALQEVSTREAAKFIAGGTNLIDLMKADVMRPRHVVDINHLPMAQIGETGDGGLQIGALVTNSDVAYNEQVEQRYPLLSKAILSGASAQLRNMATTGGNLLQRTRCYYFYDTGTPCNKRDPGAGCSALNGCNRIHAILGTSDHCIATNPSDMCTALAVLEAAIRVTGPDGDRTIPFAEFHRLPGDTPHIDTNLHDDEIITAIDLPPKGFADYYSYLKIRDRESYAFAMVSVAVGLEIEGDHITEARLALGSVAHKPWRDREVETILKGSRVNRETFRTAAETIVRNAKGFGENNYKIELSKRAVVRALEQATGLEV